MNPQRNVILLITGMVLCQSAAAIELDIRPGKWGMTSSAVMPMAPQPIEQYEEQCIAAGFDPIAEMQTQMAKMGTQCDLTVTEDTTSSFMADVSCPVPGMGEMSGTMSFGVAGEKASGSTVINMTMNGQTMQVTVSTEGSYLGPCG